MSTLSARRSALLPRNISRRSSSFIGTALGLTAFAFGCEASANTVALAWDPVDDPRVSFYEIHWGTQSGQYQASQTTTATGATIDQLAVGETYYFAAKACDETGTNCSGFSEELTTTIDYAAPVADFTESTTTGEAPLTVTFDSSPDGAVESYTWDFGDGNTSTAGTAVHSYESAGTYCVTLSVTGPGGTSSLTKSSLITVTNSTSDQISDGNDSSSDGAGSTTDQPASDDPLAFETDFPLEAGETTVNHEWKRIEFAQTFVDPVVVATSVSNNGVQPVTIRIDGIDQTGFSIRLQEWDYLDGWHANEKVGYVVVERGSHQLPNGAWLEADEIPVGTGNSWQAGSFLAPFATTPIVLTSVATYNDPSAVTTRLRGIDSMSFSLMLKGEENNTIAHGSEVVAYVALEQFCGALNGVQVVAGTTSNNIMHTPTELWFSDQCTETAETFTTPPTFLADMQTTNGWDTANVRWRNKDVNSVQVWVDEEQSKDEEIWHTSEAVGYLAIGE
jgi:PKD repeat protein